MDKQLLHCKIRKGGWYCPVTTEKCTMRGNDKCKATGRRSLTRLRGNYQPYNGLVAQVQHDTFLDKMRAMFFRRSLFRR